MRNLSVGLGFILCLQLQANTPEGVKCVAKPIDDITYSIIVEFKALRSETDGLFNLFHERAVYRNQKWSVERWTIENVDCKGTDTQMNCTLDEKDSLKIYRELGTYNENPQSGLSQYQKISSREEDLANGNITLTMKEFLINRESTATYYLRGQLSYKNNKSLSNLRHDFKDCSELETLPELADLPTENTAENSIEIRPAIRVDQPTEIPYATPVLGKPGYVYSPYDKNRILDVLGLAPGTKVKDPETHEVFRVP